MSCRWLDLGSRDRSRAWAITIRFYYAILFLSLTVSLKVKRGQKPLFDAKKIAEQ